MLRRTILHGLGLAAGVGLMSACGPQGSTSNDGKADSTKEPAHDDTAGGTAGLDEDDQEIPKTAPKVDEWVDLKGIGAPASKSYGPEKQGDDFWSGYAHSPKGAVFAASYLLPGAAAGDVVKFLDYWLVPGDDTEALKREAAEEPEGTEASAAGVSDGGGDPASSNGDDGGEARILGFRVASYTDDQAKVDVAFQAQSDSGEAGYVSAPVTLVWNDDRWWADPATFDWDMTVLDSNLTGFVRW